MSEKDIAKDNPIRDYYKTSIDKSVQSWKAKDYTPAECFKQVRLLAEVLSVRHPDILKASIWGKQVADSIDSFFPEGVAAVTTDERDKIIIRAGREVENMNQYLLTYIEQNLVSSKIYLWQMEMYQMAMQNVVEAFDGISIEESDIPPSMEFWDFDTDMAVTKKAQELYSLPMDKIYTLAHMIIIPAGNLPIINRHLPMLQERFGRDPRKSMFEICVFSPVMTTELHDKLVAGELGLKDIVPIFRVLPPCYVGHDILAGVASSVSRRFMNQTFVTTPNVYLPRAESRRLQRDKIKHPDIHAIYLRKVSSREHDETMTDAQRREFSCHFMVAGHWRKPNKRMKVQKPVYVSPHVKGNTDLPFKPTTKAIYRISR